MVWGVLLIFHLRERSCLLRCSLLLNARLQNWHLYFLSGATEALREAGGDAAADGGASATLAPGILTSGCVDAATEYSKMAARVRRPGWRQQSKRRSEVLISGPPQNDS